MKNPIFMSLPSFILNTKRENLKPQVEWVEDRANHMLVVQLPGFKREEIRVQLNNAGNLFIRGSRLTTDNKFIDIDLSFELPKDVITDKISGKFEDGRLTLVLPKNVITEAEAEALTKAKTISNEATKEEVLKKEATKQEEPKQEEEKHEQGKIEEEKKDKNIRKGKTISNEAMQNETIQSEKSTVTEAVASFVKDAKSQLTEAMHSQPTQRKEKESAATDRTVQNDFDSKPKVEEMPKNKLDNNNKDEDMGNPRTKTDEGVMHQEEKKVEKANEEMKDNGSDKVKANEVKSSKEKKGERMKKMKLKMNEIGRDTPQEIGKKFKKMRRGEDGWLNSKYIDGAVERINRNKNIIAIAVMAFSIGLYASHRLKARNA